MSDVKIKELDKSLIHQANSNSMSGQRGDISAHEYEVYCQKVMSWNVPNEPQQAAPVVSSADKKAPPREAGKLAPACRHKGSHAPALPEMQERVCTVFARTANDQRVPEVRRENPAGRAGTVRVHLPGLQESELRPDEHRGCRNHKPEILLRLRPEHAEAHMGPGQALLYDVRRAG